MQHQSGALECLIWPVCRPSAVASSRGGERKRTKGSRRTVVVELMVEGDVIAGAGREGVVDAT